LRYVMAADSGRGDIASLPGSSYTGTTSQKRYPPMTARIYKPSKTAMQSGHAKTKDWVIDFEPEEARQVEPLMGWTSSGDMRQQLRLRFASKEEAVGYCARHGIAYQLFEEAKRASRRGLSYSDNFAFNRRGAWTH
jgi:ETC complex I subunit conserved region